MLAWGIDVFGIVKSLDNLDETPLLPPAPVIVVFHDSHKVKFFVLLSPLVTFTNIFIMCAICPHVNASDWPLAPPNAFQLSCVVSGVYGATILFPLAFLKPS